jgi:hypothetical protein
MKALLFALTLSAAAVATAADCYVLDQTRLPQQAGQLYTQAINSLPREICLSQAKVNELERTVTYSITDSLGKGAAKTMAFSLRNVTNSKTVQLTTAPLVAVNNGGGCDEAVSATVYISAAYNTRTKRVEGQDVLLKLYYESNDNCHSAPEVNETFRYLTAKDIAG